MPCYLWKLLPTETILSWLKTYDWGFEVIETDAEGQRQISEIVKNVDNPCFNLWEKNFIKDMRGQRYEKLNKNQKAVITRLYSWLQGDH